MQHVCVRVLVCVQGLWEGRCDTSAGLWGPSCMTEGQCPGMKYLRAHLIWPQLTAKWTTVSHQHTLYFQVTQLFLSSSFFFYLLVIIYLEMFSLFYRFIYTIYYYLLVLLLHAFLLVLHESNNFKPKMKLTCAQKFSSDS